MPTRPSSAVASEGPASEGPASEVPASEVPASEVLASEVLASEVLASEVLASEVLASDERRIEVATPSVEIPPAPARRARTSPWQQIVLRLPQGLVRAGAAHLGHACSTRLRLVSAGHRGSLRQYSPLTRHRVPLFSHRA